MKSNDKEIIVMQRNSLSTLSEQATNLITKNAIQKAKKFIQTYNGQTDAILFEEALIQTYNMLQIIRSKNLNPQGIEFDLISNEFIRRLQEMNSLIMKARQKRSQPKLTEADLAKIKAIKLRFAEIYGTERALPMDNVVTLLLEVTKE